MALTHKSYDHVVWHNTWDPSIDPNWVLNYLIEFKDTWPNHRPEIEPKAKEGEVLSSFVLRSLTEGQLNRVDRMDGMDKIREICAYGIVSWTGLTTDSGEPREATHTKDSLGEKLTPSSLDFLSFFGFPDLPLMNILAVQIMSLTRSLKR